MKYLLSVLCSAFFSCSFGENTFLQTLLQNKTTEPTEQTRGNKQRAELRKMTLVFLLLQVIIVCVSVFYLYIRLLFLHINSDLWFDLWPYLEVPVFCLCRAYQKILGHTKVKKAKAKERTKLLCNWKTHENRWSARADVNWSDKMEVTAFCFGMTQYFLVHSAKTEYRNFQIRSKVKSED